MKVALIGLGKMGIGIAQRILQAGHQVYGYDLNADAREYAKQIGVQIFDILQALPLVDIVWIMVPTGKPVDDAIGQLVPMISDQTTIIDGGNSFYLDSIRRARDLAAGGIAYLDCGTSGGVHGVEHGFCLMVGGEHQLYMRALPVLQAIASVDGVAHVGSSGAGHYVKMIHNGIEYGLLQAYAEGFHLLKEGVYKDLDLHQIAKLWDSSSVIRSFLLSLTVPVFAHDQEFKNVIGTIAEGGTGKWTVQTAQQLHISVPVMQAALQVRAESRQTGGNYATKLVSLLREQFGGHAVARKQ
jgi:6-phosphogluconate dehydrogenase